MSGLNGPVHRLMEHFVDARVIELRRRVEVMKAIVGRGLSFAR